MNRALDLLLVPIHELVPVSRKSEKCFFQRNYIAAPLPASSVYCMLSERQKRVTKRIEMSFVILPLKTTYK